MERCDSTIEAKIRLHQAAFRELVLSADDRRCSVSGLPILELLQAAHIISDRDERGQPDVTNGICLSILHRTADDRNLLGIDPDGRIVVADSVLG
ncbi:HNH endonuclease [Thiocystis minor]|uniref:HNH endonuclease n=1 Tax=Thiocystis minor TaxID=61597 RepID=UPI0030B8C070